MEMPLSPSSLRTISKALRFTAIRTHLNSRHFLSPSNPPLSCSISTLLFSPRLLSTVGLSKPPPFASLRFLFSVVPPTKRFYTASAFGGGSGGGGIDGGGGDGDGPDGGHSSKVGGVSGSSGDVSALSSDVIILDVGGMTCGGCAASVKRILENHSQVSSASVNLATETAIVWPESQVKAVPNWQQEIGEKLADQLINCGFQSSLRGQRDTEGNVSL